VKMSDGNLITGQRETYVEPSSKMNEATDKVVLLELIVALVVW
jgi:hypothetical protein